ncbi:hypothetical protein BDR04DRAFT_1147368 [Suillus decipiens]|nr:hypothetical protein BDR04DRAFT_1147368 [Suillus decipiens]
MFLPDKVVFQTDCPDPPVDFSDPNRYAKKSVERDMLVAELYASIDHMLHAQMRTNAFFNQFGSRMQQARSSFLNGLRTITGGIFNMPNEWEAGKGKVYDIFKAPILYPNHVVNEKKCFKNWIVIAKVIKVAICGKMSLYPKARGGPPPYAKIWQLTSCTPGLIAFGVTSTIFILSPDQEFSGDGVGAISSIAYHSIFRMVKKFFVVKWTHQHIKSVVKQINGYVFDGVVKTQPSNDTPCTVEHVTESLDRVMAALDASDSDSDNESLEYVDLQMPVNNKDLHYSTLAATTATLGPIIVEAMPTVNVLQVKVMAPIDKPIIQDDPIPQPSASTPCLVTPIATPHTETLVDAQDHIEGSENALLVSTKYLPVAKAPRGRKKKSAIDSTVMRHSSRRPVV